MLLILVSSLIWIVRFSFCHLSKLISIILLLITMGGQPNCDGYLPFVAALYIYVSNSIVFVGHYR